MKLVLQLKLHDFVLSKFRLLSRLLKIKQSRITHHMLLFVIYFIFYQPSFSIEAIHFSNPFAQVLGIYDSPKEGLIISNTSGIFRVDRVTKKIEPIPFKGKFRNVAFERFFEYKNETHFYRSQDSLYRIRNGIIESVTDRVVAHFVKDDKLYLLKSREPRIQIIENEMITTYSTGDSDGDHLYANLIEINNEVYAFLSLNWSGNVFIVKIGDSSLEYIMSPNHPQESALWDQFPNYILNVNGELWIKTYHGIYKMEGNELKMVDTSYAFNKYYSYIIHPEGKFIYGVNEHGIFKANAETKETQYLSEDLPSYKNNLKFVKGKNKLYFLVDSVLFMYNIKTDEFSEFKKNNSGQVVIYIEGLDEKLFLVKESLIEWYNNEEPTIFGEKGLFTNEFWDISYDRFNKKIVALGLNNNNYLLQTFDGDKWDIIPVPLQANNQSQYGTIINDVNLEVDLKGNYFISFEDFLGKYNGETWEKLSFLKAPDDSVHEPTEDYHVLLTDSTGGVWLAAYMKEYSAETGRIENYNQLLRYDNSFELMKDNIITFGGNMTDGICKKDGEFIINSLGASVYSLKNGTLKTYVPQDGDNYSITYSWKYLCQNYSGNLVVIYQPTSGWSQQYGTFDLPGGISIYDGQIWNHEFYYNIAKNNDLYIGNTRVVFDTFGYDYIISHNKFIRIGNDESIEVFPVENLSLYFDSQIIQIENTLWITNSNNGIYKIDLPTIMSVEEHSKTRRTNILRNELIRKGLLELLLEVDNYEI